MDDLTQKLANLSPAKRALLEQRLQKAGQPSLSPNAQPPVHHLFEQQAERTPEAIAIVDSDQTLTYAQLNERANQLARHLQRLGVGPDVLVGLHLGRSPNLIVGLLAILKAGGAYVPLDPTYPPERLALMLADAQMPVVLTQSIAGDTLPSHSGRVVCLDQDAGAIAQHPNTNLNTPLEPHHRAYVIYTSGSTGTPKGVVIPHRALSHFVPAAIAEYGMTAGDRVLQFASISFDAAAEEIYPVLCCGGQLVLRNDDMLGSVESFLVACETWGLTVLDLPTAYWHQLVPELERTGRQFPERMRLVIIGGERALPTCVETWQRHIGTQPLLVNTYGPTEATIVATVHQLAAPLPPQAELPMGQPLGQAQLHVLDPNLQPTPVGIPGELHIGGPGLALGYLHRPELSAEKFIPHPFNSLSGDRLYKTGDLVRYRADGQLEFLGRLDDQVKIRGFRIELGEIETVLERHPGLRQGVVLAREDRPGEKTLVAYVVPRPEQSLDVSELRTWLGQQLPDYMLPSAFVPLTELPLTPNGKVDRRSLPAPTEFLAQTLPTHLPQTPLEQSLADIWAGVLGQQTIDTHANFFELGGHSLLAIQVIARIRSGLQIDVPLRVLFEMPTVAQMAEYCTAVLSTREDTTESDEEREEFEL